MNVTVIGSGTMGQGIAQVAAQAGFTTWIHDVQEEAAKRAMTTIHGFWQRGVAKGKNTPSEVATWQNQLHVAKDLQACVPQSAWIIEAVPEKLDLKKRVFAEVDALAGPEAILASNTSSLSIAQIAASTRRPERVMGLHFFNPVPLMALLEIVRHESNPEAIVQAAQDFGAKLGKTTITVRDSPGFATSRLGIILGNQAMRMLEEGVASAKDIDTAMRLGYGHPMGPLELSDLVGLDVRLGISDYLEQKLGPEFRAPDLVRRLVAEGALGKKMGKGIYDWTDGSPKPRALPGGQA